MTVFANWWTTDATTRSETSDECRAHERRMHTRGAISLLKPTLLLLSVSALTGCASHGLSVPKGIYLPNCSYGILTQSQPARCMTRAEYKTAKEKARHSREDASQGGGKQADSRYKDWIP
jgi:hypothetical protein